MVVLPETEQEVFDKVAAHLMRQRAKSSNKIICLYRHGELKCAAGCLIPDEQYESSIEGEVWGQLIRRRFVSPKHSTLVSRLQQIHDSIPTTEWLDSLYDIARKRHLDSSILENYKTIESILPPIRMEDRHV